MLLSITTTHRPATDPGFLFAKHPDRLHRFVANEPLRRVHECVFAVLVLESEPVDPRL